MVDQKANKPKDKVQPKQVERLLSKPRYILFLKHYLDPSSPTFNNGKASAKKAGFSHYAARNILNNPTLRYVIQRKMMLDKALRNLDDYLDMDTKEVVTALYGPVKDKETGKYLKKRNTKLEKIKQDTSKFVVERVDKKNWSQRSEVTDGDGKPVKINLDI